MSENKTVINLYNPGEKRKDDLIREFVIRKREFDAIYEDIRTSKMDHSEQPYLLVGQRGSGKSTLIQRLRYAIEDDPQLSPWLIPITFTEEQYNITELSDLWVRIAEYLEDYHDMPGIVTEMQRQYGAKAAEQKQFDVLTRYLRERKKKIIVFIDNIGDLLRKFKDIEVKRLRAVLQTSADMRFIAASPVMLDEVQNYQKALFEYFKIVRLGGIDREEMEVLLRHLGDRYHSREAIDRIIADAPERIEIMRRLTGGIVRTVVMMYNIFIENAEGSPMNDLYKLLDEATPLYKHKMDDLPVQQQKIVDAVAKNWDAITSGELSKILRMPSSTISAQLRQLEKDQWIEKIETNTKNHLYELQERFFNIWYLMRNGRKYEKERVLYFVKFMEALLEKEEIERRVESLIKKHTDGNVDKDSFEFLTEIYLACNKISPFYKFSLIRVIDPSLIHKPMLEIATKALTDSLNDPAKLNTQHLQELLNLIMNSSEQFKMESIMLFCRIDNDRARLKWEEILNKADVIDEGGYIAFLLAIALTNGTQLEYLEMAIAKRNLYVIAGALNAINIGEIHDIKTLSENIDEINPIYNAYNTTECLRAFSLLIKNQIEESWNKINKGINGMEDTHIYFYKIYVPFQKYFIVLIAKHQYQYAYQLVMNEKLKLNETDRPLYYALMHYMRDEYPNEYLRMPPEMKETTEDVIKKIEAFRTQDRPAQSAD